MQLLLSLYLSGLNTMKIFVASYVERKKAGRKLKSDALAGVSKTFPKFAGLRLEAQHFPDSPNNSDVPSIVLKPEEICRQTTRYQFFTS